VICEGAGRRRGNFTSKRKPAGMPAVANVRIKYELPEDRLASAAEIYYEAFSGKMRFLVKSKAKGMQLAKDMLSTKHCLYAEMDSECVGIAGLRFGKYSKRKSAWGIFIRHSGLFRGVSAHLASILLDRKVDPGEMRIDTLAVKSSRRGRGIGTALLRRAFRMAKENNLRKIVLEVVEENTDARRLYEREGYAPVETLRYPILGRWMGYSGSTLMEKEINRRKR
jgi:ribosomal protein S18 acetylase RimI-like enzyme